MMESPYSNPFNYAPDSEEEQTAGGYFVYTTGALLLLLLGFLGNGVLS